MKVKKFALAVSCVLVTAGAQKAIAAGDCHQANLNGIWFGAFYGVAGGNVGVSQCQFKIQDGKIIPASSYCQSTVPGSNQSKRFLVAPGTALLTKSCDVTLTYKPAQSNGKGQVKGAISRSHDTITATVRVPGTDVVGVANLVKK